MSEHHDQPTLPAAGLAELIDSTLSIPTIPQVLAEAQRRMADPDVSLGSIAEVLELDPAIAAQALRIVNAPHYGLTHAISSVRMCCIVLGLDALLNLIRQAAVLELFGGGRAEQFDCAVLWEHSFRCALAARCLAVGCAGVADLSPDTAYTCGLLHHVGKVIVLQHRPREFGEALRRGEELGQPLRGALAAELGFDDADVLAHLARRWRLGPELEASAAPAASRDDGPGWAWSAVARAADGIARDLAGEPLGWGTRGDDRDALLALGIDDEFRAVVMETVADAGVVL